MLLVSPQARHVSRMASLLLVFLLWLGLSPQSVLAQESGRTFVVVDVDDDDVLNIRAGPSAGYAVVGAIPPGGRGVRLVGHCQGWCPVSYNGALGWVNGRYLAPDAAAAIARGYVPEEPVALSRTRKGAQMPAYWRVTGVAEGESLKVHDGPSPSTSVVHAFEPESGCIKLAGSCQKPWCQVKFPGLSGDRVGWVDSKHLAPTDSSCSNSFRQ